MLGERVKLGHVPAATVTISGEVWLEPLFVELAAPVVSAGPTDPA
jgi:hypothetical protein